VRTAAESYNRGEHEQQTALHSGGELIRIMSVGKPAASSRRYNRRDDEPLQAGATAPADRCHSTYLKRENANSSQLSKPRVLHTGLWLGSVECVSALRDNVRY
jgi:hypothetical protein